MTPQVFVIAESATERYNLDGLRRYGDVKFLYAKEERKPSVHNATAFAESVAHRLGDHCFDPERDYVCLVGRQVEVGVLFYVLGLLIGSVNVLFFDASRADFSESELRADVIPDLKSH